MNTALLVVGTALQMLGVSLAAYDLRESRGHLRRLRAHPQFMRGVGGIDASTTEPGDPSFEERVGRLESKVNALEHQARAEGDSAFQAAEQLVRHVRGVIEAMVSTGSPRRIAAVVLIPRRAGRVPARVRDLVGSDGPTLRPGASDRSWSETCLGDGTRLLL